MVMNKNFSNGWRLQRFGMVMRHPLWCVQNLKYHCYLSCRSPRKHIFVVGPPRSGTTLMMRILASHSQINGIDKETYFFFRWDLKGLQFQEIPSQRMKVLLGQAPNAIQLFDDIASTVLKEKGGNRFIEKTPEHVLRIKFLRKHFPAAQFIFLVRDPRDGYLSALRNPNVKYRTAGSYARFWKTCVQTRGAEGPCDNILDVTYENLCLDPERVVREVMSFLNEPFENQQLHSQKISSTNYCKLAGHERLGEPISSRTIGEWRGKLKQEDIAVFDRIVGNELQAIGYRS